MYYEVPNPPSGRLTDREFYAAWLLATGRDDLEQIMGVTRYTLHNILYRAFQATGTRSRLELALWLIKATGIYEGSITMPVIINSEADLAIISAYTQRQQNIRDMVSRRIYPALREGLAAYAALFADMEPGGSLEAAAALHTDILAGQPEGFAEAQMAVLTTGQAFKQAIEQVEQLSPGTFPGAIDIQVIEPPVTEGGAS